MARTPDDLAGGLTDADKLLLNSAGETADTPGEQVFDGTSFVFRDAAGLFDPRNGGTGAGDKVAVSVNDSTPDYLIAKLVQAGAILLTELNDGGNETLEIRSGVRNDNKVLLSHSPTIPSGTSGSAWSDIGSLYTAGSALDGVPADYTGEWVGWVEPGSAGYEIRVVTADLGTVLGSTLLPGGGAQQKATVAINTSLLPGGVDGAIIIQHRSVGGGSGGRTYAGQLLVGRI